MDRIYVICYKLYEPCGGSFKYASKPRFEIKTEFFTRQERDKFISTYKNLSNIEKELYIGDIECFTSIPEKIEDMDAVINAI